MNMAMQMMEMHSKEMPTSGMDMAMMQECIEACAASEQACTMCAGSMMGDNMAGTMSGAQSGSDAAG